MVSTQLQNKMHLMEMAVFPIWQKASLKEREKIAKNLGEAQAKMILAEIEEESKKYEKKRS